MNIGIGVPTDMNDSARMIWPDGDGWGRMHGDLGTGPLRGDEVHLPGVLILVRCSLVISQSRCHPL